MKMDKTPPFLLLFKLWSEGGHLEDTAPFMPNGTDPPSGGLLVRIDLCASEPPVALFQLSFDALELSSAATELLKQ